MNGEIVLYSEKRRRLLSAASLPHRFCESQHVRDASVTVRESPSRSIGPAAQPTRDAVRRHWRSPPPSPAPCLPLRRRPRTAGCITGSGAGSVGRSPFRPMTSAPRPLHRLPGPLGGSGPTVCADPEAAPKVRGAGALFPSQFGARGGGASMRFSKHFAREAAVGPQRRTPRERRDPLNPSRRSRSTAFQNTWPPQPCGQVEDNDFLSVFADCRSYGDQHPPHRRRQPGERRVVSRDCICPDSAFARVRPPPSAAFHITRPGYDSRYQVLAVLATAREQFIERVDTPQYPWVSDTAEEGRSGQGFVSDSKCARWILNNL